MTLLLFDTSNILHRSLMAGDLTINPKYTLEQVINHTLYRMITRFLKMFELHQDNTLNKGILVLEGSYAKIHDKNLDSDLTFGFRRFIDPNYKKSRATPSEFLLMLYSILPLVAEACNLAVTWQAGFEADDVLAACARIYQKHQPIVISADKDLGSLPILFPGVKTCDPWKMEPIKKWHPQALALLGDISDTIPGVDGLGPVNVEKFLTKDLMSNLWELGTKPLLNETKELKLLNSLSRIALNQHLVKLYAELEPTIYSNGQIMFKLDDLPIFWQNEKLQEFVERFQLERLLQKPTKPLKTVISPSLFD